MADWLPEPLTVPTRIARSLIVGATRLPGACRSFFDHGERRWHDVLAQSSATKAATPRALARMPSGSSQQATGSRRAKNHNNLRILGVSVALSRLVHHIPPAFARVNRATPSHRARRMLNVKPLRLAFRMHHRPTDQPPNSSDSPLTATVHLRFLQGDPPSTSAKGSPRSTGWRRSPFPNGAFDRLAARFPSDRSSPSQAAAVSAPTSAGRFS